MMRLPKPSRELSSAIMDAGLSAARPDTTTMKPAEPRL
jgi:hypothetical protein